MNDTSKKALIVLAGIAVLVIVYMYVFRGAQEDIEKLDTEITTLQTRLDDLTAKEQQKDQLIAETAEFNAEFQKVLENYPADLNQETAVEFLKGVEEANEFINKTFSMPRESEFYKLGKTSNTGAIGQDALSGEELNKDAYTCTTTAYGINYSGSYEGIKSVLQYVADYRYRMNVSNLNISHDDTTDKYMGSITINAYAIAGPDRTPESVDPGLPAGTDNLFFAGDGSTGSGSSASSKYDADKGAGIVTSNNLLVILNSANSDLSSGIIASSNADKEETYVSSNENSVVGLSIDVYAEDGKNFMKYSIGSNSYTTEILSEDVAIYVKSSARVDANDTNGVEVSINNTSTLSVFFKVVDDDATSPRFKLGTRSGSVKVYK
jgi:uncharacterized protein YsxB (DUF464 family)